MVFLCPHQGLWECYNDWPPGPATIATFIRHTVFRKSMHHCTSYTGLGRPSFFSLTCDLRMLITVLYFCCIHCLRPHRLFMKSLGGDLFLCIQVSSFNIYMYKYIKNNNNMHGLLIICAYFAHKYLIFFLQLWMECQSFQFLILCSICCTWLASEVVVLKRMLCGIKNHCEP